MCRWGSSDVGRAEAKNLHCTRHHQSPTNPPPRRDNQRVRLRVGASCPRSPRQSGCWSHQHHHPTASPPSITRTSSLSSKMARSWRPTLKATSSRTTTDSTLNLFASNKLRSHRRPHLSRFPQTQRSQPVWISKAPVFAVYPWSATRVSPTQTHQADLREK